MKKLFITITIISILIVPFGELSASPGDSCKDVQFMFARGSGTPQDQGSEYKSFQSSVQSSLADSQLTYTITDLSYPAVATDNLSILLMAFISGGRAGEFANSVAEGKTNLLNFYQKTNAACPATKWVLFGYSQGARVITTALESLNAKNIIYIAMLGDPNLHLPEGEGFNPPACRGQNLSSYRRYAPNCDTDNGILGARKPYLPTAFRDKIGIWCNNKDLVCGSSKNIFVNSGHMEYTEYAGIPSAVEFVMRKIKQTFPTQTVNTEILKPAAMNTVIIIDATGSMKNFINLYKAEAARLAAATINSGGKVALYIYRDIDIDEVSAAQLCDFDCTLDQFTSRLNSIKVSGGGLDAAESLLSASLGAMNELKWQVGAVKSVVVLTDAPFLNPDRDGTSLAQVVKRSLEIDPVNFYVITREKYLDAYTELTSLTGGKVFNIDKESVISTDYIISRPVVMLPREHYIGVVGDNFTFDASASYDIDSKISHFDWDLDGDGNFEITNHGATIERTYDSASEHFVVVRAVSEDGQSSTMSAKVSVAASLAPDTTLSAPKNLTISEKTSKTFTLSWQNAPQATHNLLVIDDTIIGILPAATTSVTISDLDIDKSHNFILTSVDKNNDLGESATASYTVNRPSQILAPSTGAK